MCLSLQQQNVTQEVENLCRHPGIAPLGTHDGTRDLHTIVLGYIAAFIDIRPVDREAGDALAQAVAEHLGSEVASVTVNAAQVFHEMRQHVELARERDVQDELLALVDERVNVGACSGEALV